MIRLEMYVDEGRWKALDEESQCILNSFIQKTEELIVPVLENWNRSRCKVGGGATSENELVYKIHINEKRKVEFDEKDNS